MGEKEDKQHKNKKGSTKKIEMVFDCLGCGWKMMMKIKQIMREVCIYIKCIYKLTMKNCWNSHGNIMIHG